MKIVDLIPRSQFSWIAYPRLILKLSLPPFAVALFYFWLEILYYYNIFVHPYIGSAIGALRQCFGFGGVDMSVTISQHIAVTASVDSQVPAVTPFVESSSESIPLWALLKSLVPTKLKPGIGLFLVPLSLDIIRSIWKSWQSKVFLANKRKNSGHSVDI